MKRPVMGRELREKLPKMIKNGGLNLSNSKHQTLMQTVWMGTLVQAYFSLSMGKQSSASKRKKVNAFCWDACFWTKIEELGEVSMARVRGSWLVRPHRKSGKP